MSTTSAARGNKRQRPCSFCEIAPASVVVNLSTGGKRKVKTPLCWLHYYTSRAVRVPVQSVQSAQSEEVEVLVDEENIQTELNESGIQDLFAEAYLELQQDLATESALSFQKQKTDPLSILNNFRGKRKPNKQQPGPARKKLDANGGGGFMRSVSLPERFQKTQQDVVRNNQQNQHVALLQAASSSENPYQKRKPSRKSIWKLAMEKPTQLERDTTATAIMPSSSVTCSCGSTDVKCHGNVTSRNNDVQKAETWGFKDRSDEIITRHQCYKCGKTWNEEE